MYDEIVGAVDFEAVMLGVVAVAVAWAVVLVVRWGVQVLLVMVEGARIRREDAEDYFDEMEARARERGDV
jgi:hypothetical protein